MYLTKLKLDVSRRETMRALISPNIFHGAIESSFLNTIPPEERKQERERLLWRIDKLYGETFLLLLSERQPELSSVVRQFGFADGDSPPECRAYDPLLNRITDGSRWHFKLRANPVICKSEGKPEHGGRGKLCALAGVQNQRNWLFDRAPKYGFSLDPEGFDVTGIDRYSFLKGSSGKRVSLLGVTFEGVLTVTDADTMRIAMTEGIGRGKAYGMGLLTVMRCRDE